MDCLRNNVGSLYPSKVKSYVNFHNKKVNMLIYCLYIQVIQQAIQINIYGWSVPLKCSCLDYEEQETNLNWQLNLLKIFIHINLWNTMDKFKTYIYIYIHTHTHTQSIHGARQIWPVWSQVWVINGIDIIVQLNHPIVRYLVMSQEVILFQSNA